eukprot:30963-Pelagococcus_subviridis.AAC.6
MVRSRNFGGHRGRSYVGSPPSARVICCARSEIPADAFDAFNRCKRYSPTPRFQHLIASPFNGPMNIEHVVGSALSGCVHRLNSRASAEAGSTRARASLEHAHTHDARASHREEPLQVRPRGGQRRRLARVRVVAHRRERSRSRGGRSGEGCVHARAARFPPAHGRDPGREGARGRLGRGNREVRVEALRRRVRGARSRRRNPTRARSRDSGIRAIVRPFGFHRASLPSPALVGFFFFPPLARLSLAIATSPNAPPTPPSPPLPPARPIATTARDPVPRRARGGRRGGAAKARAVRQAVPRESRRAPRALRVRRHRRALRRAQDRGRGDREEDGPDAHGGRRGGHGEARGDRGAARGERHERGRRRVGVSVHRRSRRGGAGGAGGAEEVDAAAADRREDGPTERARDDGADRRAGEGGDREREVETGPGGVAEEASRARPVTDATDAGRDSIRFFSIDSIGRSASARRRPSALRGGVTLARCQQTKVLRRVRPVRPLSSFARPSALPHVFLEHLRERLHPRGRLQQRVAAHPDLLHRVYPRGLVRAHHL